MRAKKVSNSIRIKIGADIFVFDAIRLETEYKIAEMDKKHNYTMILQKDI